jgi:hypothetical protein
MDKYWKEKWVDALRSGGYIQTKGALSRLEDGPDGVDTYCCLGVLCELFPGTEKIECEEDSDDGPVIEYKIMDTLGLYRLPTYIKNIVDISNYRESTLVKMNDDGKTFEEIADHINDYM